VHRLELEYPDLYEGLQRVAKVEGPYHERLMWPLASQLWTAAIASGVDVPLELRSAWKRLEANSEPPAEVWEEFGRELKRYSIMEVGVKRAGFGCVSPEDDSSDRETYRAHWLMARTMEVIGGWEYRPLPLADIAYAAAAVGRGDIRAELEPKLRMIEDELGLRYDSCMAGLRR